MIFIYIFSILLFSLGWYWAKCAFYAVFEKDWGPGLVTMFAALVYFYAAHTSSMIWIIVGAGMQISETGLRIEYNSILILGLILFLFGIYSWLLRGIHPDFQ